MYVGMGDLHREHNDLTTAAELLQRSVDIGEHLGLPQNRHRWHVAKARLLEAEGDLAAAEELYDEAERSYTADFSPDVRPVAAQRARLWVAQGRLEDAFAWARERELTSDDEISYLREFEHVTLARALLGRLAREPAEATLAEATGLLRRLLDAAEAGQRTGTVVELLALEALAHQLDGDTAAALAPLERSLALAEPEGYVRLFLDLGTPMVELLRAAARHGTSAAYVGQLLGAGGAARSGASRRDAYGSPSLSEREQHVLRLLGTELGGPEIARELVLSLNTVRTHTRNIYAKLGVTNRRAAVRRAQELDLLPDRHRRG